MKKNHAYLLFFIVFILLATAIVFNYSRKTKAEQNKQYTLVARKGVETTGPEWKMLLDKEKKLLADAKANPADAKAPLYLAALYIQEARETGNHAYYDIAALRQVNHVLSNDSLNFNALVFKSLICLSQHHFAEGLSVAGRAQQVNPYNAYVYGLLVDANVEMGYYDSALVNAERMMSIRPDLTSYSRVSYLREIFGDYTGAIEAMQMAVDAGNKGDENTEWARVQLGGLYEKSGDYKTAASIYHTSLEAKPGYAYALAGTARIAMAAGDYAKAIASLLQAQQTITDNSIQEELAEAYRLAGQPQKADAVVKTLITQMAADATGKDDGSIGHYADKELAYAYLHSKNNTKALEHALMEYNRRPQNIDVNETVAWVYYNNGDYKKALPYMQAALKTNAQNPILLCRAALVYAKNGNNDAAKTLLAKTSAGNPYISGALKDELMRVLPKFIAGR
ncbi:tetratricopeptide repeat protein [Foetidibacter luteolus]|uniref:tetratricopeptide repeat protein n=1 Tax=Foetidibacter luteolus TaxID=2608880 RepID=UPI00129AB84B|nr:tetratricopeptide repeat protein [Foetidibacter luteolus]